MKRYERVSECKNQSVDGIAACVLVKVRKSFFQRRFFIDSFSWTQVLPLWRTPAHKALRVHQNCGYTVAGRGVLAY